MFVSANSQDYAEYARGYGQKKNNKGSLVAGLLGGTKIANLLKSIIEITKVLSSTTFRRPWIRCWRMDDIQKNEKT
jgi:hypothetical protein